MDIIELARQMGKEIQKDNRYINLRLIEQRMDADGELQKMMGSFNENKDCLNNEMSAKNPDQNKINRLNIEIREQYSNIMSNPNMIDYNESKGELEAVLRKVNAIIMQSANGHDPMTADYSESCAGGCGSCGGCS